ncbi:MAG: hypothetical protein AAF235_05020 [Planctomycetota bacterium]
MTEPPPQRRGIRDIEQASDHSSAPGSQQNVFWKLFKLETRRLMAEREQQLAEQRAQIAQRRADQAASKMRGLLNHDRVTQLGHGTKDADDPRDPAVVGTRGSAAELLTHRYGPRARRSLIQTELKSQSQQTPETNPPDAKTTAARRGGNRKTTR